MEWKFPVRNFWKVCIPHRLSGYQEIPENAVQFITGNYMENTQFFNE